MIDTHTHLYLPEFSSSSDTDDENSDGTCAAVQRALDAGVSHMVMPNVDLSTLRPTAAMPLRFPGVVSVALGLHPTSVDASWRESLSEIEQAFDTVKSVVAVGEVGMDLYWDKTFAVEQAEAFGEQIRFARSRNLPVIIHCREALRETLEVINSIKTSEGELPPLLFHSFTGSADDVRSIRAVAADAMFGIGGVVTFKNAGALPDAVREIGISHIMLETDSPYLAPVPKRGRRNESAYVVYVLEKVAQLVSLPVVEAERITDANARAFFSI